MAVFSHMFLLFVPAEENFCYVQVSINIFFFFCERLNYVLIVLPLKDLLAKMSFLFFPVAEGNL